ncbi:MAG: XRE family transcriptional regulator [Acidobacteria bacterium]|nr:XRE family transcriptional regulator [Acidobacteriota bacterium]
MSEFSERLAKDFQDREYREVYAEDFLNTSLATQISVIREQRGLTQKQLAEKIGTQQAGVSRVENVNYAAWNINTLRKIAYALGARLKVSIETYRTLVEEAEEFCRETLQRPAFEDDPFFRATPTAAGRFEDSPTGWMSRILVPWLEQEIWRTGDLVDWFQGYGLPVTGEEEYPFRWILRSLPLGAERNKYKTTLAARLASLLDERPDVDPPGRRPDDVLYNLFMLCAGLDSPDQLAEPLCAVYERLRKGEIRLNDELRDALRAALARNQIDNRLRPVWERMITHGRDDNLLGNEYEGFAGVRRMPASAQLRGWPDMEAVGCALKKMADHVGQHLDREREFRSLIGQVKELYPADQSMNWDLLAQAHDKQWPDWAWSCVPRLFVWRKPDFFLFAVDPYLFTVQRKAGDRIRLDIRVHPVGGDLSEGAELLRQRMEAALQQSRLPSPKGFLNEVNVALEQLQLETGQRDPFERVHQEVLLEQGFTIETSVG